MKFRARPSNQVGVLHLRSDKWLVQRNGQRKKNWLRISVRTDLCSPVHGGISSAALFCDQVPGL
jgi:hypothetical protein